eukprot:UN04924
MSIHMSNTPHLFENIKLLCINVNNQIKHSRIEKEKMFTT